jgi:ParB-like chromosome segregation protein Spo0J
MGCRTSEGVARAAHRRILRELLEVGTNETAGPDEAVDASPPNGAEAERQRAGVEQRSVETLRLHPRANEIPEMDGDQFAELLADIGRVGVTEPVQILDDGTIVDGRHRWLAAKEAGLREVPCVVLPDLSADEAFGRMVAGALLRRHLTASQRAALAVKLAEVREAREEAAKRQAASRFRPADRPAGTVGQDLGPPQKRRTRDAVADAAGVSHETAREALELERHAPDLLDQVAKGKKTVHAAAKEMQRRRSGGSAPPARRRKRSARSGTATAASGEATGTAWTMSSPTPGEAPRTIRKWAPMSQVKAMLAEAKDLHESQLGMKAFYREVREQLIAGLEETARLCAEIVATIRSAEDDDR